MGTLSDKISSLLFKFDSFNPNLFEVRLLNDGDPATAELETTIYCTGFSIPGASLDSQRLEFLKQSFSTEYKVPVEVEITWQEDAALTVWNYHQAWLSCFYDRKTDTYVPGPKGKKRQATIFFQDFVGADKPGTLTDTHKITLHGLVPKFNGGLKGSWDESSDRPSTIKYTVDLISYQRMKDSKEYLL